MAAIKRQNDSYRSRYASQCGRRPSQASNSTTIPEFASGFDVAEWELASERELLAASTCAEAGDVAGAGCPENITGSQVRGTLSLTAPFIERVRGLTRGFTPPSLAGFNRPKESTPRITIAASAF